MPSDRKAVAFVTNVLNEVEPWVIRGKYQFATIDLDQLLKASFPTWSLRHADQPHSLDTMGFQHFNRLPKLPFTAIDKEYVRKRRLPFF